MVFPTCACSKDNPVNVPQDLRISKMLIDGYLPWLDIPATKTTTNQFIVLGIN